METLIKDLRNKLFFMAYTYREHGIFNEEKFNYLRDELLELQECEEVPCNEYGTDWNMWDGSIDTIVVHSDNMTKAIIDGNI